MTKKSVPISNDLLARARAAARAADSSASGTNPPARRGVPVAATRVGKVWARNPLLDEHRSESVWEPKSPPPELFNSGAVPPYTASGNNPAELLRLPWQLRHAAAKA